MSRPIHSPELAYFAFVLSVPLPVRTCSGGGVYGTKGQSPLRGPELKQKIIITIIRDSTGTSCRLFPGMPPDSRYDCFAVKK